MSEGYSVRQAARMVGKSRKTLYGHISSGKISAKRDREGNRVIDKAELLRVYGSLLETGNETGVTVDQGEELETLQAELEKLRHHNQVLLVNLNAARREVALLKQGLEDARASERAAREQNRETLSLFNRLLPNPLKDSN